MRNEGDEKEDKYELTRKQERYERRKGVKSE